MPFKLLYISVFLSLSFIISCKDQTSNKDILAEYKGKYLYRSDIPEDVWKNHSNNDSNGLLKSIVDKWLQNCVLLVEAEESLRESDKNKDKLIEDYRNSLLIYSYEQQLIREKLDTGVTEDEILAFYEANNSSFQLKKNIVKIKYIKVKKSGTDIAKIQKMMQNAAPEANLELKTFAEKEAENFYLDSNWLYLDDITKEIPINENYNQQRFLSNNKFISIEENDMFYLLFILDFRIKDAVSPLEFEREKIKDIIRYQRKLSFLKQTQIDLFKKALESGEIKYYLK